MTISTAVSRPRAVLVSVRLPRTSEAEHVASLAELLRLCTTLGFEVVATITQRRRAMQGAVVLGAGKLAALARLTGGTGVVASGATRKVPKAHKKRDNTDNKDKNESAPSAETAAEEHDGEVQIFARTPNPDAADDEPHATIVVADNELSPSQIRNLEKATGVEVLDRTGVIIEIFHRHARTHEARLQVEIARLAYEAPRLREKHLSSDRQRGGTTGSKGQTDLEMDRQRVRDRIAELKKELIAVQQAEESKRNRRTGNARVALVGYTNAGKSSLMRALTGSEVLVADSLFATLGTTVRTLEPLTAPRILVSDTVGFINNLPHDLVASFRSTLDEARDASLLLFVVDVSDPSFRAQLKTTQDVLREIGGADIAQQLVLNKIDRVPAEDRGFLRDEFPEALQLSALSPADIAGLHAWIVAFFERAMVEQTLIVPHSARGVIGEVRENTRVVAEDYDERGAILTLRAPAAVLHQLQKLIERE